jgi:hypothetical protein
MDRKEGGMIESTPALCQSAKKQFITYLFAL